MREKQGRLRFSEPVSAAIKKIHFSCIITTAIISVLYGFFALRIGGIWSSRMIVITLLITGLFYYPFTSIGSLGQGERSYFRLFSYMPSIVGGITFVLPYMGIILTVSLLGRLSSPIKELLYEDDKLRVESQFAGILGPPKIHLYEKGFLWEKRLDEGGLDSYDLDSVSVSYDVDSTRITLYGLDKSFKRRDRIPEQIISLKRIE